MDADKFKEILESHGKWLNDDGDIRADLHGADLRSADLHGADLHGADLRSADLHSADLRDADLRGADLRSAYLRSADLRSADLCGADLRGADLLRADLCGADLDKQTVGLDISCPEEGAFIGYKKAADKIVVLEIAADSRRSSATTRKCRCSKAKVLRIEEINGSVSDVNSVPSNRDGNFIYEVGKTVEVKDFDDDRWNECSTGIHFFINKEAARRY